MCTFVAYTGIKAQGYTETKAHFSCRLHLQSKFRVRVGLGNS